MEVIELHLFSKSQLLVFDRKFIVEVDAESFELEIFVIFVLKGNFCLDKEHYFCGFYIYLGRYKTNPKQLKNASILASIDAIWKYV